MGNSPMIISVSQEVKICSSLVNREMISRKLTQTLRLHLQVVEEGRHICVPAALHMYVEIAPVEDQLLTHIESTLNVSNGLFDISLK